MGSTYVSYPKYSEQLRNLRKPSIQLAPWLFPWGKIGYGVNLYTHLHVVSELRTREPVLPYARLFSRRRTSLNTETNLLITYK